MKKEYKFGDSVASIEQIFSGADVIHVVTWNEIEIYRTNSESESEVRRVLLTYAESHLTAHLASLKRRVEETSSVISLVRRILAEPPDPLESFRIRKTEGEKT